MRTALEEARGRGWRLAILSNTDRDFIEASKRLIGVPFDATIVASEVGSYKPAFGHWRAFEGEVGRMPDVPRRREPLPRHRSGEQPRRADRLGQPFAEHGEPAPTRELRDLAPLADVLDELVPA